MLCKRLIYKLSASIDAEEAMINRLKVSDLFTVVDLGSWLESVILEHSETLWVMEF